MPFDSVARRRRGTALVAATAVVLLLAPVAASAAETADAGPLHTLASSALTFGGLAAALVVFAFLVNRFAPKKKRRVRRAAILLILYVVASGLGAALAALGAHAWSRTVLMVAELFGVFTGVNLAALAVFDLGLAALGVEVASIVADLAIGGAYLVATLSVLRRAGVDLTGLVAATTVVTSILALSLQATLGNILGGVALQLDDSIRPGDWIQLENGKQGKVREIRWRHTVVETRDWDTIVVPNAALLGAHITILGKREGEPIQHRMWVYFNVDFRYPPADVIHAVEEALHAAPIEGVSQSPPPNVVCMDFSRDNKESFALYAARYWLTDLPRDDPTSSRVRARIYSALKRAGIPLAVPAAQIFVEQDDLEKRERKRLRENVQRIGALGTLGFLHPLTDAEREELAAHLRYAPFAAGETITRQGAVAHWLYIVTEGTVEVRVAGDGFERVVTRIEAPGFFGEMGLMTGAPRAATVVAVTDVECYRLDKAAFDRILAARPEVVAEISQHLAQRRIELEAVRDDLDAEARKTRLDQERKQILGTIQRFFGLAADEEAEG